LKIYFLENIFQVTRDIIFDRLYIKSDISIQPEEEGKVNTLLESDKNLVTEDYFLLATLNWNDKLEDFLPVDDPSTATQTFNKYSDAENAYFSMNYENCNQSGGKDVKIELIHMRFGVPHIVRNQMLMP
jgi:hypothetical protein